MEPILGAGGVIVPDASFMRHMREVCDRYGILLISDEVICGFGRTGDWTGARHWGVQPDMMTIAKGITSGYFPVGGALVSGAVAEVFESADAAGALWTGYTYSAHPVGSAGVVACLSETLRLDTKTNAAARGTQLYEGVKRLAEKARHHRRCARRAWPDVRDRDRQRPRRQDADGCRDHAAHPHRHL